MSKLERFLRSSIKGCLAAGPLPSMIQSVRSRRCLSVLTYHSVIEQALPFHDWSFLDAGVFRRQMAYLKDHFTLLPLSDALDLLEKDALDEPSAAITFDDGFQNNFDVAFPILQAYQVPATIYLTTDLIGTDATVWFTRLLIALQATRCESLSWQEKIYPLKGPLQRAETSALLQRALKPFPAGRLEEELAGIERRLRVPVNPAVAAGSPFRMLGHEAIRVMGDSGLIEFGAHTRTHAILSKLTSEEKEAQIRQSVHHVETLTGKRCQSFAYPNGGQDDFDPESQRILREAGVFRAVTMLPGANCSGKVDSLEIHRYPIGADTPFSRFRLMAHNVI